MSETVFVALSGGVDSTCALITAREQGYDALAVTMVNGYPVSEKWLEKAKKVAFSLGITLHIVDLSRKFQKVVDYFIEEYLRGRTPNPCAFCNRWIKFGALKEHVMSLGADFFVTGHYACITKGKLSKAKDREKDQSYFLCLVEKSSLDKVLFPMCEIEKKEAIEKVKSLLNSFGRNYRESQEICFLQGRFYGDFLKEKIGSIPGKFVDTAGKILGEHEGFYLYTIGQRRVGLSFGKPLYVVDIIPEESLVVMGEEELLYKDKMKVEDINWLVEPTNLEFPLHVTVKIRHQHKPAPALLYRNGIVEFETPQRAITPGQVACFYKEDTVIAGAIISKS